MTITRLASHRLWRGGAAAVVVANVFVCVERGLEGRHFHPPSEPAVIDQRGCWFRWARGWML
jgi:hypothetical protein